MNIRVVWKKNSYDVTFPLDEQVLKLKEHIQKLTGIVMMPWGPVGGGGDLSLWGDQYIYARESNYKGSLLIAN